MQLDHPKMIILERTDPPETPPRQQEACFRCGKEATHYHGHQAYCEECRGCYESVHECGCIDSAVDDVHH